MGSADSKREQHSFQADQSRLPFQDLPTWTPKLNKEVMAQNPLTKPRGNHSTYFWCSGRFCRVPGKLGTGGVLGHKLYVFQIHPARV